MVDTVTFTVEADGETAGEANTMGFTSFNWVEDTRVYQETDISSTEYVVVAGGGGVNDDANISVSARLLDQYGAGIRVDENGNAYRITLTLPTDGHMTDAIPADCRNRQHDPIVKMPTISSSSSRRGMARALFAVNQHRSEGKNTLVITYPDRGRHPERRRRTRQRPQFGRCSDHLGGCGYQLHRMD